MPPKSTGLRAHIAAALAEDSSLESVRQLVADVFGTEAARKVTCPGCKTAFRAPLPDVKAQVQTLIDLLEQSEGKAASQPQPDLMVIVERPPRS